MNSHLHPLFQRALNDFAQHVTRPQRMPCTNPHCLSGWERLDDYSGGQQGSREVMCGRCRGTGMEVAK